MASDDVRRIRRALAKGDGIPEFFVDACKLTPAMLSAIKEYKARGNTMNAASAGDLAACFDHACCVKSGVVYRGVQGATPNEFRSRSTIQFDGFASTTMQRELAEAIAQVGRGGVLFRIYVPIGIRALDLGELNSDGFDSEREVILPPETEFAVVGVRGNTLSVGIIGPRASLSLKRTAKANRRPTTTEARKPEVSGDTLREQVQRAAHWPVQHCLDSQAPENGMVMLLLARGTSDKLAIGGFLIDLRVGIKDAYFRIDSEAAFKTQVAGMADTAPLVPVDPNQARARLREVAAWAASKGSVPHRDFPVVEQLFGDVGTDAVSTGKRDVEGGQLATDMPRDREVMSLHG